MAGFIPEEIIEEIRQRCNIVELIGRYVQLKPSGSQFVGLCPFHEEKTPSFYVNPDTQLYYCFGCQNGGDIFAFLMQKEGWSFPEAVRFLAQEYNIPLTQQNLGAANKNQRLYELNELVNKYYQFNLTRSVAEPAREYLKKRGLSGEIIKTAELGFAADGWDNLIKLARTKGFSLQQLAALGLVVKRQKGRGYYDRFRSRIMFPIRDILGRVVGFGGRIIGDGRPKYLNSPESALFSKRRNLYGLFLARQHIREADCAIVMEGYLDVLAAWQYGFKNAVASLGTALTDLQAQLLARYTTRCVICYDADAAGAKAAMRGLDVLAANGLQVAVAQLPAGMDPDDFLRQQGADAFREIVETARPLVEYKVETIANKYDLANLQEKVRFVEEVVPVLAAVQNDVAQAGYISMLAEQYNLHEQALRAEVAKFRADKVKKPVLRNTRVNIEERSGYGSSNRREGLERQLLHIVCYAPEALQYISIDCFGHSVHQKLYERIQRAVVESQRGFSIKKLLAEELCKEEQQLLASFAVSQPLSGDIEKIVTDLCRQIELLRLEEQIRKLQQQIRELEKVGEVPVELLQQLVELQKESLRLRARG